MENNIVFFMKKLKDDYLGIKIVLSTLKMIKWKSNENGIGLSKVDIEEMSKNIPRYCFG